MKTENKGRLLIGRAPPLLRLVTSVLLLLPLAACASTEGSLQGHFSVAPGTVTSVMVRNVTGRSCHEAPITFGQPLRRGDVKRSQTIVADLGGRVLPTQVAFKARNPDGSARHAIITVQVPCSALGSGERLALVAVPKPRIKARATNVTIAQVLRAGFRANVKLDVTGKPWSLAARPLLKDVIRRGGCSRAGTLCRRWLSGPIVSEWIVGGPVRDAQGQPHPHLAAYFAIRAYGPAPVRRIRVDVIVENDWAYQRNPRNYKYDASIGVGGKLVYRIRSLNHYRQARWHKVFWWGRADPLYAALNSNYLQESGAVPRYETTNSPENLLSRVRQSCAPMQPCDQTPKMGNTGAQAAIGPLPRWSSIYVLHTGYRAYRWMLANSDALGAYGIHYRSKSTGQPVSVDRHPCLTLLPAAEVARCPAPPHRDDRPPPCHGDCASPLIPDESHHPAPAYVAYMVTGDWYYMQELAFWADWVVFWTNPAYRDYSAGLIHRTQVRGQAWALRTLGDAAYILPDTFSLKRYFNTVVENNIRWYNRRYTDNPDANKLHLLANYYAIVYPNHGQPRTGIATWQMSFFEWSLGNLVEEGFKGARQLRNWFAPFQIGLMTSPAFCWELASAYELQVRNTQTSPLYQRLSEVYHHTFPDLRGVPCKERPINAAIKKAEGTQRFHYPAGSMIGYPDSPTGYPAYFQIGLAAAVSSRLPGSRRAWEVFMHRASRPNYSDSPKYAVVPRSMTP